MPENSAEAPRPKEPEPIIMTLTRGTENPKTRRVKIVPAEKDSRHPFQVLDEETQELVTLGQRELFTAYTLLGAPVPEDIKRGLETSEIIAKRKRDAKKPPKLATDEESLESLVENN